ncbi:MAG: 4-hydroxy-tetrahydrodipicolinate reductase [Bryobacteraceae bacterium]
MNLAIVGYGKMGHMVEQLAPSSGFTVCARILSKGNANGEGITKESLRGAEVAIEFTEPASAPSNIERLAAAGVNIVCGTTGWHAELSRVRRAVERAGVALIWGRNFSIGVNIFTRLVGDAARFFETQPDYGAWGWEIHHAAKKDAPSGTLLQLVEQMQRAGYTRQIDVGSSRAGTHPGTHEIGFDSPADTITLRHTARSRQGFAQGALLAAQKISGRQGVFEFSDVLLG